jgi:hypothetical protein
MERQNLARWRARPHLNSFGMCKSKGQAISLTRAVVPQQSFALNPLRWLLVATLSSCAKDKQLYQKDTDEMSPPSNNNNTPTPTHKDNMSIGSAESLAPRWVSPEGTTGGIMGGGGAVATSDAAAGQTAQSSRSQNPHHQPVANIHWVGVLRDDTMLAEYCNEPDNPKILQMSRRFLKSNPPAAANKSKLGNTASSAPKSNVPSKTTASTSAQPPAKVDWEFKTYAVQSQRRMVHAIKFIVWERVPLAPGARAKLIHLQAQSFLNGESVRIIEYQASTEKYLIRPSIPLPEAQKLATTGMLVVHSKNLLGPPDQDVRYWTVAVLYDGKRLTQNMACQFMEKILLISETFRKSDEWVHGSEMSCQSSFAPILASQMAQFEVPAAASIDESLEYTKDLIAKNRDILAQTHPHLVHPSSSSGGGASVSTSTSSTNAV